MAVITATKRIAVETLKKMDDNTKQNLVLPLNQLNEQVVNALNKGLTIGDNLLAAIMTQRFTSGVTLIVNNPLSVVPIGVTPIAGNSNGIYVENMYLTPQSNQSKVGVTVSWQPVDNVGIVTFILWGG